jgi:hypothetical protein
VTTRTKRPNHRTLLGIFLTLVLLLTACSDLSSSADVVDTATDAAEESVETSDSADFAMEEDAMEEESAMADSDDGADRQAAADGLGAGGATGADLTPSDLGRDIIFTAEIGVEVDDVAASGAAATDIIADLGGFVFGQSTVGGAEPRSVITFKVAPARFSEALEALGSIGELRNQSITTDDVTERVVDLTSRIEVAELGVERLRTAMENAPNLEQFAELEGLLLARESDLEVMRGQLRTIRDRVDLATITLTLSQDRIDNSVRLGVTVYGAHDDGVGCPGNSENVNVPEGAPVTLCFEVTNTGDQTLRDLTLTDTVLEIDGNDDLLTVFGSLDELAPGQSAMLALEISPDRASQPRLRVTGIPTDGVSDEATGPAVATAAAFQIRVCEAETDPGFRDGFDAAWDLLKGLWVTLTVLIGFLVPLLIFVPIAWLLWKASLPARRRLRTNRNEMAEEGAAPPPPPYAE